MFDDEGPIDRPGAASWRQPFHWWGPPWHSPEPKSLVELVELGMLTARQVDWLVYHLDLGGSLIVAAVPQGAGKSTLADALIAGLHSKRIMVYVRGMFEPFDWVNATDQESTTLLVNEISPHMPIYAWGETVQRLLALGEAGYQIIATIHADTVEQLLQELTAYPIEATTNQIAALDVVVFITVTVAGDNVIRRVERIDSLAVDEATGGLNVQPVTV